MGPSKHELRTTKAGILTKAICFGEDVRSLARTKKHTLGLLEERDRYFTNYTDQEIRAGGVRYGIKEPRLRLGPTGRPIFRVLACLGIAYGGVQAIQGYTDSRRDSVFTASQLDKARGDVLQSMSFRQRFTAQFIAPIGINNPQDGSAHKSSQQTDLSGFEGDEVFGSKCLRPTAFNTEGLQVNTRSANVRVSSAATLVPKSANTFSIITASGIELRMAVSDAREPLVPLTTLDRDTLVANTCQDVPQPYIPTTN